MKLKQGQTVYIVIIGAVGAQVQKTFIASNAVLGQIKSMAGKIRVYDSKRKATFDARMYSEMRLNGAI